jgi:hypothetical protein
LDWQTAKPCACSRCSRAFKVSESLALPFDIGVGASLFFLVLLPLLSAAKGEGFTPETLVTIVLILASLILTLTAAGWFISNLRRAGDLAKRPDSNFLIGLRFAGFVLSVLILARGDSPDSIANSVDGIFGPTLGDRLIAAIGANPMRDAAIVLLLCVTISCGLRWAVPFVFGARPLAFVRPNRTTQTPV